MEGISGSRAYEYAKWCTEPGNGYVGAYIKRQAEKWLKIADGRSDTAYVDERQYTLIARLLRLMKHPDLGCTMYDGLEDYAMLFITALFCTRFRTDNIRFYHTGVLEIGRKNYKTFSSAVIFIIGLLTEPRFSRFFSVAPDLKLSSELQVAIKKIIKSSPALADEKIFKLMRKEIRCKLTESEFTPLAYSNDRMDGKLAAMFLADECGALTDNYPIEAMRSSQITLREKLGIIISTQYPNDKNAMTEEIAAAKQSLDGLGGSDRCFALLYEPDERYKSGDSWKTEDIAIYQANPAAVRDSHLFEALLEKRKMAVMYENRRKNFLCKHMNIQYTGLGTEGFIDLNKVRLCSFENGNAPEFWQGRRVYLGLDLSLTEDNTSVAMVTLEGNDVYAMVWGFIPAGRIDEKSEAEKVDYNALIADGCCFACGDEVIDYSFVEDFIQSLPEKYGVEIVQLGFDRWNAMSTVQKLERSEKPIECVEIRQHSSVLHRPTKLLKELVLSRKFHYGTNKMLEINFANARCTEDTNLNKYVNKKRSTGKVDMVVSLINALYLLQVGELDGQNEMQFVCQLI